MKQIPLRRIIILSLVLSIILTACGTQPLPQATDEAPKNEIPSSQAPLEPATPTPTDHVSDTGEVTTAYPVAPESSPLSFVDPVFEGLLKAELKKDEIFAEDLSSITNIKIGGDHFLIVAREGEPERSVILLWGTDVELDGQRYTGFGTMKSLADLAYFPNLNTLHVTLQPELDYTTIPQATIQTLRRGFFTQSKLKDIEFLRGATSLFSISLSINEIQDLSPLSDSKNLLYLSGSSNLIEDLSPLASLTSLKSITLYENRIKDLSPLSSLINLETLELYANQVEDLTPLANLQNLKNLELINNNIKDVSPLKGFTSFEELWLSGNPIENIQELSHIENLDFAP